MKQLPLENEPQPGLTMRLKWLENLEGHMFERFVAEWLRELPGHRWSTSGVQYTNNKEWDIDVLGIFEQNGRQELFLGECKRNASAHKMKRTERNFEEFLKVLKPDAKGLQSEILNADVHTKYLISPFFDPKGEGAVLPNGFKCLDIHSMAQISGIDPGPLLEKHKVKQNENEKSISSEPEKENNSPYDLPDPYKLPSPFD